MPGESLKFRHIFIVTYGRSGSTLLNGILNSIPGVCLRGENLNTLAFLCRAVSAADYAHKIERPSTSPTHPWNGSSLIEVDAFRRKLIDAFVEHVLKPPADAEAIGFKEIRHGIQDMSENEYDSYIQFILGSFERSCIIFNIRSWREVARSEWWISNPLARSHLRLLEARFNRSLALHPESTFLVDYSKYIVNPDELRALFSFLHAGFDREMIERVLQRTHSYHSSKTELERLRSKRSISIAILEAMIRKIKRTP
jgi:hypothetical protein